MTSVTPFGQTGPYKHYKSTDLISVGMGGIAYINPRWAGTTEQEPMRALQIYSFISGIIAAVATMCALRVKRGSGIGQHVDVSQMETSALALNFWGEYWPYNRTYVSRADKAEQAPVHDVQCKDGWVGINIATEEQWKRLLDLIEKPQLAEDERYCDVHSRGSHWDSLEPQIMDWMIQYTKQEIFEKGKAMRVPLAPVHTLAELVEREQFKVRHFFTNVAHPVTGIQTYPGAPYKLAKTPWTIRMPAPMLGQHNVDIYKHELRLSDKQLHTLKRAKTI